MALTTRKSSSINSTQYHNNSPAGFFGSSFRNLFTCFGTYESSNSKPINHHYFHINHHQKPHQESEDEKQQQEQELSPHQKPTPIPAPAPTPTPIKIIGNNNNLDPTVEILSSSKYNANISGGGTPGGRPVTFSTHSQVEVLEIRSRREVRMLAKPPKRKISKGKPGQIHRPLDLM